MIGLTKAERVQMEESQAKQRIFLKRANAAPRVDAFYYAWCKQQQIPFLRITKKGKVCRIMLDAPHYGSRLDFIGLQQRRAFATKWNLTLGEPSSIDGDLDGVPLDEADALSADLFRIASEFYSRKRQAQATKT